GGDLDMLKDALATGTGAETQIHREFRIHREDNGELRWIAAKICAVSGDNGGARTLSGVCFDVTTRRQEQEARDLVAQEIGHRMKNLLSIVGSLVSLSGEHRPEAREFIGAFQLRLNSLAA